MAVERERGISVSSAVMSFEQEGLAFNLLDTPGHQDFSPLGFHGDTYGTLTAVPHPSLPRSRGRVREGATRRRPQWRQGGIEEQTRKLFEVCRLRDVPIITFVNKLDARPATRSICWTRSSSLWRSTGSPSRSAVAVSTTRN